MRLILGFLFGALCLPMSAVQGESRVLENKVGTMSADAPQDEVQTPDKLVGKVLDENGEPMYGATVTVESSSKCKITQPFRKTSVLVNQNLIFLLVFY